jgi:hypothetical protein
MRTKRHTETLGREVGRHGVGGNQVPSRWSHRSKEPTAVTKVVQARDPSLRRLGTLGEGMKINQLV